MPIRRLIALCQEHNVLSMIDGAHAPGQLPLNLEEINADFYTGEINFTNNLGLLYQWHSWCDGHHHRKGNLVQILDMAICISHNANKLGKIMNPTLLFSAIGK